MAILRIAQERGVFHAVLGIPPIPLYYQSPQDEERDTFYIQETIGRRRNMWVIV